ncbi:MAG: pyridoxine 5'-phosphate synthase [Gammaproteobacteria bacterium]|nr:pyridoxine 5'-phosphate synthase [Gammaproteobacteria bacterium]
MTRLSVNLNKIALLRNARGSDYPNLLAMARRAVAAGVHGITVHPRPDQRHIRHDDVPVLAELCAGLANVEFNIEGNPTREFLDLVIAAQPDQCTLVPDDPGQLTSDHGWNLEGEHGALDEAVAALSGAGIRVSLFMDPVIEGIDRVPETGAHRVELYTESYARAFAADRPETELERFAAAARRAGEVGLGVNAGHDLNLDNLGLFLARVPDVLEVSIGHAIVVESFDHGFEGTLERYLAIVNG